MMAERQAILALLVASGRTVQTNFTAAEAALDLGKLQVLGHRGRWYDCRRNGQTKRWKRNPHRASIPVKVGFREAFRLEFDDTAGGCGTVLRICPPDFNPRTRE
jgi:hypothetical protein